MCAVRAGVLFYASGRTLCAARARHCCRVRWLAVVDAATLQLFDVVTQSLLWLRLLFNRGTTFAPLPMRCAPLWPVI